jgi:hypothetical protein
MMKRWQSRRRRIRMRRMATLCICPAIRSTTASFAVLELLLLDPWRLHLVLSLLD